LLPLLAGIPVLGGGDEWQLRLVGVASGIGLLLATWWLGRLIAGPIAGVLAAAILYTSPALQMESATLLTDVPAAALLVLLTALLWQQLEERPAPGRGLVVAALVAAAAFFMRYGSILALIPLLLVASLLWWRRLRSRPRILFVVAAVGVVASLGHLAWSMIQTGDPLGVLRAAQNVVSVSRSGSLPMDDYQRFLEFTLAGSVGHVAMIVGAIGLPLIAIAVSLRSGGSRYRHAAFVLVAPAVLQIELLTQGVAHAEERFFVYSTALLVIAGAAVAVIALRRLSTDAAIAGAALLLVVVMLNRLPAVDYAYQRTAAIGHYYERFEIAGRAIAVAAGPDCGIVGSGEPILAWYSRCEAVRMRLPADGGPPGRELDASDRWAVLFGDPVTMVPDDPAVAAIQRAARGEPLTIVDPSSGHAIAQAWRIGSTSNPTR
jgi:4-amino-4-deoxy-L-arabinose transferase-like glycosyltransferase